MRALRLTVCAALIAGAALLSTAAPAAAAGSGTTTYHGVFTGVTYDSTHKTADGTWNVTWRGDTVVSATFNIFVDGQHHLAYGLPGAVITTVSAPDAGNWSFSFPIDPTVSANPLVVSLTGSQLTYRIAPYSMGGQSYAVVTYFGTLST